MAKRLTRRDFLHMATLATGGAVLAACAPQPIATQPTAVPPTPVPPTLVPPTVTPIPLPTLTLTITLTPTPTSTSTPTSTPIPASVLLPIPPRAYAHSDFCGEVCIQEALLYFGKNVSQQEINHTGGGDGVQGLWSSGVETALKNFNVGYNSWRLESPDYDQYIEMLKSKLAQGHPVLVGVKVNPTAHPDYFCDHFILLIGYDHDSFIYDLPESREKRSFVQFRDGDTDGSGLTLTNPFNLFFGVEFTGQ